jgi:hypothetical protein
MAHPYLDWDFFAHSNECCISLKHVPLFCVNGPDSGTLGSTNSQLQQNVLTLFCLFTVGVQQLNTSQTAWIKMGYVNGGVFRGKVISDLHLLFWGGEKNTQCCFIIFGNCMRPFYNY